MNDPTAQISSPRNDRHPLCFLFWNDFMCITHDLSQRIQKDGTPEVIIGLQRGGLIPAVCLSHQLEVRTFLSLPVRRTVSDEVFAEKTAASVMQVQPHLLRSLVTQRDILVVDDIAGTGESIKAVLSLLASFAPARIRSAICVVNRENWNPRNTQMPVEALSYVGKEVYGWVVFPWERSPGIGSNEISSDSKHLSCRTIPPQCE